MKTDLRTLLEKALVGRTIQVASKKPRRVLSVDTQYESSYESYGGYRVWVELEGLKQPYELGIDEDFELLDA